MSQIHSVRFKSVGLFLLIAMPFALCAEEPGVALSTPVAVAQKLVTTGELSSQPAAREVESLWAEGKKAQAKKRIDRWMHDEKDAPWPWVQAAVLSHREGNFNKAQSYLKTALAKSPQCADAYFWRGKAFESQKKPLDAANEYRAALVVRQQFQEAQQAFDRLSAQLDPK